MTKTVKSIAFVIAFLLLFTPVARAAGWVDFLDDVRMHQDAWVNDDITVDDDATVAGTITMGNMSATTSVAAADLVASDDLDVTDDARITGTVTAGNVSATTSVVAGTYVQGADLKGTDDLDIADDARITGTVTAGDVTATTTVAAADLSASDDLTVSDDGSINDLTVADLALITPQSVLTLTMNGWLTPTGTMQPIASAGAVSIDGGARIADLTTGTLLILVNTGSQTITISETAGLTSAGNVALAAGDSATLQMVGTTWYQIGASNN